MFRSRSLYGSYTVVTQKDLWNSEEEVFRKAPH